MFIDKQGQRAEVMARPRIVFDKNQMKPYLGEQQKIQFLSKNNKVEEAIQMTGQNYWFWSKTASEIVVVLGFHVF